jgi:hypothetical protein
MSDKNSSAKAFQAIGEYFCAFSQLDRELGDTIKVALRVQNHDAGDMIVAALGDVARKASLLRAAVRVAKTAKGSDTTEDWKNSTDQTISKIFAVNDDRVLLAHSLLEPQSDGAVKFTRLHIPNGVFKSRQGTWTQPDFTSKVHDLADLTSELSSIKDQLNTLQIKIPDLGWLVPLFSGPPLGISGTPLGSPRVLLESPPGALSSCDIRPEPPFARKGFINHR